MTDSATEENRQFEQVLSRLDALMKRSHDAALAPSVEPAAGHDMPAVEVPVTQVAAPDDGIPVLTEVYVGELATNWDELRRPVEEASPVVDAAILLEELMPVLAEVVERLLQEELTEAQQRLQLRMQEEVAQALRLHLEIKAK